MPRTLAFIIVVLTTLIPSTSMAQLSDEMRIKALLSAAEEGNALVVRVLADNEAHANARNEQGFTALIIAASKGHTAVVEALIDQGADVNAQDTAFGDTALMYAARHNYTAVVEALLANGADVNAKSKFRNTALMYAAEYGYTIIVRALMAKGVNLDVKNRDGKDALKLAEEKGRTAVVELLTNARAQREAPRSPEAERARMEIEKLKAETEKVKAETEQTRAMAEKTKGESAAPGAAEVKVDIEQVPSVTVKAQKDAYAVVVGIEKYTDLIPPDYAVRDARWMKEYLIHVLGYPEENIQLLTNEQATGNRMRSAFETWLPNQEPRGAVFVYYSGHGAPDPATGESYLVPADGAPSDLQTTGYSLKRLAQALGKLPANEIVVVMDSCFSGQPGTRSVIAKGTKPMVIAQEGPWAALGDRGIVFTAGNQVSTVYEEKKHGLFTYFFLKGLQGAADLNGDGAVQAQELFTYLRPEVVKTAKRQNVRQEPGLWPPAEQLGSRATRSLAAVAR